MAGLELVLILLAVSAGLRLVAERLTVPYAAVLVVGGLLLAFIPGLPRVTLPPDILFLVFVPPLLCAGAISFPLRDFRRELGPILRLSPRSRRRRQPYTFSPGAPAASRSACSSGSSVATGFSLLSRLYPRKPFSVVPVS